MDNIKTLFIIGLLTLLVGASKAQSIGGIVNSYARVTSISGKSFSVDNILGAATDFKSGDIVLIIQMKGAAIDRNNNSNYGTILNLNNAGNYEYAIIKSIAGYGPTYTVTVQNLIKSYDANAFVQIVSVPQYNNVAVSTDLTAAVWNKATGIGGVLAIDVYGTLNLAANIDLTGKGFAGGNVNLTPFVGSTDVTNYVTTSTEISGQKGEGIATYGSEGHYAMGPLANGGGGGNSHNGGGGGGGNFSAGGFGGDAYYGPGGNGMAGKQIIAAPSLNKLFMGGGGGGGQENNNRGTSGGAGGGLILLRVNQITADCAPIRSIKANGATANNTTGDDGAGGGGAGGTILLDVVSFNLSCNIDILTNGGSGGSVTIAQKHGGGGGGGAGAILLPGASGNAFTNIGSSSGAPGADCTSCSSTGSPGDACSGDACTGDGSWPDLPNSSPVAVDDDVLTPTNTAVLIEVLNNDRDADFGDVITLSAILITPPANGTLSQTGNTFTYTPAANFVGVDFFEYEICDDNSPVSCSNARVNITVNSLLLNDMETDFLVYTEGDAAVNITAFTTISQINVIPLVSAAVKISTNYMASEDILEFSNTASITGTWDASSGTLTLSGSASLAAYQTAIRSIQYRNANNNNPSDLIRVVTMQAYDGTDYSNTVSRSISVIPVNDAPVLSGLETTSLAYTEGDAAKIITSNIVISDVDNTNMSYAYVWIDANYSNTEDVLAFTNANGITGSWNSSTGLLSLSGSASLANYQAALRSVTYRNTNNKNPSTLTRKARFTVHDGTVVGNKPSRNIVITAVNDAPVLAALETTALSFTEGDAAKAITASLTVNDVDNANMAGATVKFTANFVSTEDVLAFVTVNGIAGSWNATTGVLTLSGSATLAQYQAAIRSVTYKNTNNENPSNATRTVSITLNDGSVDSNVLTRQIKVVPVNDAPQIANLETAALSFTEGDAATFITGTIKNTDVDNANLSSAQIRITANYVGTEDVLAFSNSNGISGSWDTASGTLTLTGSATLAQYQSALRAVSYQNVNKAKPSILTRIVSITVNDGATTSNVLTRDIEIVPVNDKPVTADDVAVTDKNVPVVINVLGNDFDVEDEVLTVSAVLVTAPLNGTVNLNADQTFTYTPDFNFFGTDSFEYQVCDNGVPVECSSALVAITINYKNYAPIAENDLIDILEDESIIIEVMANDSDPDLDEINVSLNIISAPRFGKVTLQGNKYNYIPNLNYNGNDSFEYEICDNGTPSICTTALVDIYIEPVNDAPEPADDEYENKAVIAKIEGNVLDNDYDIEADMLSVDLNTLVLPEHGQLSMNADGSFSYMPEPGFFGEDTFKYFVCDDGTPSLCTQATVLLKISSGVPKGFSPNGDNTNDEWIISGLEKFPMNTVVVLNRYGDIVYEIKGYDNNSRVWRGEVNRGIKLGSGDSPDGTYFYVIDFGDGKSAEKGFVMIKR